MKVVEIPLEQIDDRDRARQDYGSLTDIQVSATQHGLYQPITIRKHPDPNSSFNYKLVAGGRRLAALRGIPDRNTIPSIIRESDDLESLEIEMLENFARKDFTWYERVTIVWRINEMMIEKGAERLESGTASNWGIRDTANLIHKSYGAVQRQLQLYKFCELIPALREVENEDQAVQAARKIMEKSEVEEIKERQAEILETSDEELEAMTDDPEERRRLKFISRLTKAADANYRIGDALDGLREMVRLAKEEGVIPPIKLCEVDPPYAIDLLEQKKGEGDNREEYEEISRKEYPFFIKELTELMYSALPKDCHVVFWHGPEWYELIRVRLKMAGFNVDKIPCIWTKPSGQTANPDRYLGRGYEQFIYAWKGEPILVERGRLNVFNYSTVSPSDKFHPTQRPIDLMCDILSTFTFPGEIIMVPFLGSGTTLLAAYRNGNLAFGWDLSKKYKESFLIEVDNEIRNYHLAGSSEEAEETD